MATKFSDIFNRAIFYFQDYEFLKADVERRDDIMSSLLLSAVADFQNSCSVDLTDYDTDNRVFNVDLGDEEKEILALGIAYYWINRKALNSKLLKNLMTRSDYTTYSPANLLKEISSLRDTLRREYRFKINEYSYRHGTLDTLKADN